MGSISSRAAEQQSSRAGGRLQSPSPAALPPHGPAAQRERSAFTLLELIVVIAIFLLISGMLLANFRRSRQGDIVRIAALRLTTDIQRMQSAALSGGVGDRAAVAYGMHADVAQPDRYILFGDRTRCEGPQDAQVCRADGRYNAGVDPVEEIEGGVVSLSKNVRIVDIRTVNPDAAISDPVDALFRPPRGTVAITPDTTEVRIILRHTDFDDTRTVTVNRISGRVSIE